MPLNRPALSVGSGARSVHQARHWVVGTIRDLGRPELAETTELGVSELVTNALLHSAAPIEIRVRGTRLHPRVEVRDGTSEPPTLPDARWVEMDPVGFNEGRLLVTYGRGLDIVARCSDAWGAEIEADGKVMWFAPAVRSQAVGVPGVLTGRAQPVLPKPEAGASLHPFRLLNVPLPSLHDFQRHYQELRREVRLLSLAHEREYPLAHTLSDLFGSMHRELREGLEVQPSPSDPDGTADVTVSLSADSAETMGRFVELLDFADEFCSRERMLTLARTPEQRTFQTWFLTEFVRQAAGRAPQPWTSAPSLRTQA